MSKERKRLPVKPSAEHLRKEAKKLRKQFPEKKLASIQHELAKQYGCKNWAELMHMVETMLRGSDQLANVKAQREPLPQAAREKDLEEIEKILLSGHFTQHDLDLALAQLHFPGGEEIAELLLENGADVNGQYGSGYGPIILGWGESLEPEGFQFMIDHGCDVTFKPIDTKYGFNSPLISVLSTYVRFPQVREKKHKCIKILQKHGAYHPAEVTPPMMAIHQGDAAELTRFIKSDPSLIHQTFPTMPYGNVHLKGATLLHMATEFSEIECMEILLKAGADVNTRSDIIEGFGGQTPLFHAACNYSHFRAEALSFLVDRFERELDLTVSAKIKVFFEEKGPGTVLEIFNDQPSVTSMLEKLIDLKGNN